MKRRSLALFWAAFVTIGAVLVPMEEAVFAAGIDTAEAVSGIAAEDSGDMVNEAENVDDAETEEEAAREYHTGGLLPMEVIEVSDFEIDESDIYEVTEEMKGSAVYSSEWDQYSNNYFYNQMSASAKSFWNALDAMCLGYLTGNKTVDVDSKYQICVMDYVYAPSMSKEQMVEVYYIFRYSNPQYYFLNSSCLPGSYGETPLIAPVMYTSFGNGAARANATAAVKKQIESWQTMINACANEEQKVKLIHDLIIQKVEYNNAIYDDPNFDEDTQYSQSAYSVFCTDLTVCAGYSQAFEMMCNGSGIDAIAVTSADHEWNKVRVNDSWYNVDCTWDDAGNAYPVYYDFFARNDAYYDSAAGALSHQEEKYWEKYLPLCTLDSTSAGWNAGIFPPITLQTAIPEIKAETDTEGDCEITITCASADAKIYYTTDGSDPAVSAAKSLIYKDSFFVTEAAELRAIAVSNACWDSEIAVKTVIPSEKCRITFQGNGATSGSMGSQTAYTNSTFTLNANKFKKTGYSFAGWNTQKNGKGISYTDKQTITNLTGDLTLYAQWKLPSYKITYKLNGGTNSKKNPASYNKAEKVTLKNPSRKGYTFKGWYRDKKFTTKTTVIKKGSTGKITLYAKWQANVYTVKFNGNGSTSGKMSALTSRKYGSSYRLSANKFKKKGYVFVGWNTKKNGSGQSYSNKQKVKNLTAKNKGTVTLYAQWQKK